MDCLKCWCKVKRLHELVGSWDDDAEDMHGTDMNDASEPEEKTLDERVAELEEKVAALEAKEEPKA